MYAEGNAIAADRAAAVDTPQPMTRLDVAIADAISLETRLHDLHRALASLTDRVVGPEPSNTASTTTLIFPAGDLTPSKRPSLARLETALTHAHKHVDATHGELTRLGNAL